MIITNKLKLLAVLAAFSTQAESAKKLPVVSATKTEFVHKSGLEMNLDLYGGVSYNFFAGKWRDSEDDPLKVSFNKFIGEEVEQHEEKHLQKFEEESRITSVAGLAISMLAKKPDGIFKYGVIVRLDVCGGTPLIPHLAFGIQKNSHEVLLTAGGLFELGLQYRYYFTERFSIFSRVAASAGIKGPYTKAGVGINFVLGIGLKTA